MSRYQPEELARVTMFIANKAEFMFVPRPELLTIVANGKHPHVKALPEVMVYTLLRNIPIRIEASMALSYYNGTMDEKNTFIFDRGDIKVIPPRFVSRDSEEKEKEENE